MPFERVPSEGELRAQTIESRQDLSSVKRVVIKAGTSVVTNDDGRFSLVRLSSLVEQIAELRRAGIEVILVSSGAVGCGRMLLRKQALLSANFHEQLANESGGSATQASGYSSACASAGQLGLMSLYDTLFQQVDVAISQFLVTSYDFTDSSRRQHLEASMEEIISHGMVPIVNENDAVSGNQGYTTENVFSDNDALASIVAGQLGAEVLLLLTDVGGLYDRPPSEAGAKIIDTYNRAQLVSIGDKSARGRGGMGAKVDSALRALDQGVQAVVIASGKEPGVVVDILGGVKPVGTLFIPGSDSATFAASSGVAAAVPATQAALGAAAAAGTEAAAVSLSAAAQAAAAKTAARALQALSTAERSAVMKAVAAALRRNVDLILDANAKDLEAAKEATPPVASALVQRLKLSAEKVETLAVGVEQLADMAEPIGKELRKTELATGLELTQVTVPIGVLLIVFESRPESLVQIAALCLRSGNGLLLKGGKEAELSNAVLHKVVTDAVFESSEGKVARGVVALVTSRDEVTDLLQLDQAIDLVIPRGSKALVEHIKKHTRIPVLGHADGVCHVFVDAAADQTKAVDICVDAKVNYPAACNACETVLFHQSAVDNGLVHSVLKAMRQAGVKLHAGPAAVKQGLFGPSDAPPNGDLGVEYGDLTCLVEVVPSLAAAVAHIHAHGSSHTECIVTEDKAQAKLFMASVDSACVFHNASTRFADGFRFGFGAEVGISTGRIHARGPVGVEGLLTTKWLLTSQLESGDTVAKFGGEAPERAFTHKPLPLSASLLGAEETFVK